MTNSAEQLPPQPQAAAAPPPPQPGPAPAFTPAINDPRRKRPIVAAILSVVPGLGQVYVGYYKQGFINAITFAVLVGFMSTGIEAMAPLVGIFLGFFYLYNIVDAGRRASLYNQALAGGGDIKLPDSFEAPSLGGSLAGGAALILVGLVVLSHTAFGASLAWVEDWWPLALIGFGGWLVYKAIQDRAAKADDGPFE